MFKKIDEYNFNYKFKTKTYKITKYSSIYNIEFKSEQTRILQGIKILILSDTHFKNNINQINEYKILNEKISKQEFDLVFHLGDIIDKNLTEFKEEYQTFLKSIKSKLGKYFVLGNHDYYKKNNLKIIEIMKNLNFINLINTSKKIKINQTNKTNENNSKLKNNSNNNNKHHNSKNSLNKYINIIGLDDNLYGKPSFEKAKKNIKKKDFNILLSHNLDSVPKDKINYLNLILSGHLHEGEFNFGIINGIQLLKIKKHYNNIHKQTKGFKSLEKNTLSFSHPGNYSIMYYKFKLPRFFTNKAGTVILNFK